MIPYSKQSISNKDIKSVKNVLKSDFLTQGPAVPKFEKNIKSYVNSKFAIAVNSATSALHLSCLALGLKKGDWLWTCTNSFVSSANCGLFCGAKIDLVDIDINSYNISISLLEKKLKIAKKRKRLPKILVPVHFGGRPCNMKKIYSLSKKYNFKIVEDASHALGSEVYGSKIGNCKYSSMCVFSFHPVKNITTGEGGMITTNNKVLADRLKILRTHGINKNRKKFISKNAPPWFFEQIMLGYNYRMNDIEAALGISQLKRIHSFISRRNKVANYYYRALKKLPIILPKKDNQIVNAFHLYPIRLKEKKTKLERLKLFNFLRKKNININVHYIPIHYHPYYKNFGFKEKDFPNVKTYYNSVISLPIFPDLNKKQIINVISAIKKYFTTFNT